MKWLLTTLSLTFFFSVQAQNLRIDPPNWWVGMKNPAVQLMLHGENIGLAKASIQATGVVLERSITVENPNYLFLDLTISKNCAPGIINIQLQQGKNTKVVSYELKERKERSMAYGLDGNDFIYLIMPDRFANGDTKNDIVEGTREQKLDRSGLNTRHGGDLSGVISQLDYLNDLGVTATWLTPPQENDQPLYSYHGYAITDHYNIDPRFGTLDIYREYVQSSHARGMQVVYDVVYNHVGDQHYFIKDLPSKDWINQWDSFTRTNYRTPSLNDMYGSEYDRTLMTRGWFDNHMPDLNQSNPLVANYLRQQNIWWIEEMQVDALRIDTYPYGDQSFLSQAAEAILHEYPGMTLFAEIWVHGMGVQGFYNGNNNLDRSINTHLSGVLDFEMCWAFNEAVNVPTGWNTGLEAVYLRLTQDFMYGDEGGMNNVIFLDNHDMSRFYNQVGMDLSKFKMATAMLLTMRGIPHWFYGSEILMDEPADPMDLVRTDFPGGWPGDSENKFESSGRTKIEEEAFQYIRTIANFRKTNKVFSKGKLMQWVPENGIYVYFRYTDDQSVMIAVNSNDTDQELTTSKFAERMTGYSTGVNIESGEVIKNLSTLSLPAMSTTIIELKK